MRGKFDLKELEPLLGDRFLFGVGTAAYQIEGATTSDGRSDSIWDKFCRQPGNVRDGDTGEVACDHYKRWREDVALLQQLGVDAYRFSISWSRVFPDESGAINERGIAFYAGLVDELRAAGIRPLVTLYHWDLPQYLQDKGGWANRDTVSRFAEFAEAVAICLGDSVDFYSTINEPWCVAFLGHKLGIHAPGIRDEQAAYRVAHHLLLAHGLTISALRRWAPHAELGIVLNGGPSHPATESAGDLEAAEFAELEQLHLFAQPLLTGHYPVKFIDRIGDALKPGDLDIIGEPCDYLGWNYYTRSVVRAGANNAVEVVPVTEAAATDFGWEIYPKGLKELLRALGDAYELPPMYITENGAAFDDKVVGGAIADTERIAYLGEHLKVVAELVREGFDIRGYVCWSLMDNFEWAEGFSKRFGLVRVDYDTQVRTVKKSGRVFAKLLASRAR